jgi:hypothetical protein
MCENWVVLFFGTRFAPPKKDISSNIGQLVTFQSILGSSIDLRVGNVTLVTWSWQLGNVCDRQVGELSDNKQIGLSKLMKWMSL